MEKVDSKKTITSDIDEGLIGFIQKTNILDMVKGEKIRARENGIYYYDCS